MTQPRLVTTKHLSLWVKRHWSTELSQRIPLLSTDVAMWASPGTCRVFFVVMHPEACGEVSGARMLFVCFLSCRLTAGRRIMFHQSGLDFCRGPLSSRSFHGYFNEPCATWTVVNTLVLFLGCESILFKLFAHIYVFARVLWVRLTYAPLPNKSR